VTAPIRIFAQSSSVVGLMSTTPLAVISLLTASKMLSAMGSMMFSINSLMETYALRSDCAGGGGAAFDAHAASASPLTSSAPAAKRPRVISVPFRSVISSRGDPIPRLRAGVPEEFLNFATGCSALVRGWKLGT
jgi:hypothetical protein